MGKHGFAFHTNANFHSAEFDGFNWIFHFEDGIVVQASGFWRLLKDGEINLVSRDHGHQFGLPKPVDLQELVNGRCRGQKALELKVNDNTGDLQVIMSAGLVLEIFISSTGYETYQFSCGGRSYIGTGGGEIAIM